MTRSIEKSAAGPATGTSGSLLPLFVALGVILVVGVVAERRSRDLAIQAQRAQVQIELEALRDGLETRLNHQIDVLSQLSGALVAAPAMSPERFAMVATRFIDGRDSILAFAALPARGTPLMLSGEPAMAADIADILAQASPGSTGTSGIVSARRSCLILWRPVVAGGSPERLDWGLVAAVIDAEALFDAAGLRDSGLELDLALSTADSRAGSRARALQLGHAAVLSDRPVKVGVAVPVGNWELAARPRKGWNTDAGGVWPIRILTLVSLCLVGAPMWRTRHLMRERQDHVAELARLSQRLGLALDASTVGVWDFNIDTDELIWDSRMDELYGYSGRSGRRAYADWRARLHPDDLTRAEEDFRVAIEETGRYDSEYRIVLDDGSMRHIRAIAEVYRGQDGHSRIVGVNWDVTADICRQAELEDRRAEAEAALNAKSQFLATVTHEIRTPMNGIIGMLDLLLGGELDPAQRERAALVRSSAGHLLDIVNDILDLSRLEADRIALDPQPMDVRRLAADVVTLMSAAADGRDLRIFSGIDARVPELVIADQTRLRQILCNLIGNAAKFTDSGTIELRVGHDDDDGGTLHVAVRDTGVGIPEASKAALFARYAQVDPTGERERRGTGLGLAICRELVEAMGGEIGVESVPGLGSTFSFWIPAPAAGAPASRAVATESEPRRDAPARSACILVADDSATNRRVISGYLEMAGHEVVEVETGADALAARALRDFDLLILDVQMPVMDGLAVARAIREAGSAVPIIAVTGRAAEGEREAALAAGMDEYLTKPVDVDALFGAIDRIEADRSSTRRRPDAGSDGTASAAVSGASAPGPA